MNAALIITSIASPNEAMEIFATECKQRSIQFIVVGDRKSPSDFYLDGCRFINIDEQGELPFVITKLLPENHYSRKNIGYLLAKQSDIILETDDDNFPKKNFWKKFENLIQAPFRETETSGWINAYRYFTKEFIWPRGFPLEFLKDGSEDTKQSTSDVKIFQGLTDEDPDVDAVFRLTNKLPFNFSGGLPLVLKQNQWCPFNSQNTTWLKEAFPLLYLPSYCSMRMTDIWRSFIAQRILWTCNWQVAFHSADCIQKRNNHDLVKDFQEETIGYLSNNRIKNILEDLDLKNGPTNIPGNMLTCYKRLIDEKIFPSDELKLLQGWLQDAT